MIEKPSCYWVHMVWEDVTRGSADGKENGPKTPLRSTNDFYKVLLDEEWSLGTVPKTGKEQYYVTKTNP